MPRISLSLLLLPIYAIVTAALLGHSGWNSDTGVYYFSGHAVLSGAGVPRTLGHDTLTPGLPWVSQEWLFGMLVAMTGIDTPAFVFVKLLFALAACAALGMYAWDLERRGVGRTTIVSAVALIASAMPIALRIYVLTYPLALGFAFALRRRDAGRFIAPAIALLWVNLHASFPLMFVICAAEIAGAVREREAERMRALAILTIVIAAVAAFANPFGPGLIAYAARGLTPTLLRVEHIDEWQPLDLFHEYPHGIDGVLVFVIAAIVGVPLLVRTRLADQILLVITFALALHAQRHTPYFYLLGTPIVLVALQRRLAAWRMRERFDRFLTSGRPGTTACACAAALALALGPTVAVHANDATHDRLIVEAQPLVAALPHLTRISHPRLVCSELRQCAQAMWLGDLGIPHMLDSRTDPFPPSEWADFIRLRSGVHGWRDVLTRWNLTDVLVSDEVPLFANMRSLSSYRAIEQSPDGRVVMFERRTNRYAPRPISCAVEESRRAAAHLRSCVAPRGVGAALPHNAKTRNHNPLRATRRPRAVGPGGRAHRRSGDGLNKYYMKQSRWP
jgi:hypothetical protein